MINKVNPRLIDYQQAQKILKANPTLKIDQYFEKLILVQKQLNVVDFQNQLKVVDEAQIDEWVEQFCYRNHLSQVEAKSIKRGLLKKNRVWLKLLAKNPTRQNLYEKGLMWWIKYHLDYEVVNLSTSPDDAYYAFNNLIAKRQQFSNDLPLALKSLDFKINSPNAPVYVIAKWTDQKGGHQDNQRNDIDFQLSQLDLKVMAYQILVCLDGKYWKERVDYFKTKYPQLYFCNGDNIKVVLERLLAARDQHVVHHDWKPLKR